MVDFTPLLRGYSKYRRSQLAALEKVSCQESQLLSLLKKAQSTEFGKDHGFNSIRNVNDFQKQVPLRTYENFWNDYWKPTFPRVINKTWPGLFEYYCWTSGTTSGTRKFVPYTKEMSKSYNKAGIDLLVHHVANRPNSRLFGGKSFMLGGTTKLSEESDGVYVGEVSGFSAQKLPWWTNFFFFPPKHLSDIADWMERADRIAEVSWKEDVRLLGGMPSWLLIFLDKLKKHVGGSDEGLITRAYPNLELFVHGGVNFDPYLNRYKKLTAGGHAEFREIYPASEGFFAVADRGYKEGLRLILDHDIFYEFVPVEELNSTNPTRHWVGNIETDINYAIVLSTCAGVWSYVLGDTVRFIDVATPRLLITGRTSYALSAFGEHLINEEIERAVSVAADSIELNVHDFCVRPEVSTTQGELGYHVYYVEFLEGTPSESQLDLFTKTLDETLRSLNDDYADHRAPGCGVLEPKIVALKPGTFAQWMKSRGKLGDQHKVARTLSAELANNLEAFIRSKT